MLLLLVLVLPCCLCIDTEECQALGNPKAKCIIDGMLEVIEDHIAWDDWEAWYEVMKDFLTEDMVYDSNWTPNGDFSNNSALQEFFDNEHIPFNLAFDNTNFAKMIWIGGKTRLASLRMERLNGLVILGQFLAVSMLGRK